MKIKMMGICFFLITGILFSLPASTSENEDELPQVKMIFINQSRFPVHIHFYNNEALVRAHILKEKEKFELDVDHGLVIHLEYAPSPHKTVLKPIDSINQISRTITFTNDGEHIRIKEKFKYTPNAKIETKKKKRKRTPEEKHD